MLNGSRSKRVVQNGHDRLRTWGILAQEDRPTIRDWIEQLANQGFLAKESEYHLLRVTPRGRQLLSGQLTPRLLRPNSQPASATSPPARAISGGLQQGEFTSPPAVPARHPGEPAKGLVNSAVAAFAHFRRGESVEEVARQLGRAPSTVYDYLAQFLVHTRQQDPTAWVDYATAARIEKAAKQVGLDRLKPIFEALEGRVPYTQIHIVVQCLRNAQVVVERAEGF